MSREYKNILNLRQKPFGFERRTNLAKEVVQNSTPLPNSLEYEDIDNEFIKWVDNELAIASEGVNVPTFTLLSNQRFSEYMQSWQHVDDKKNLILNFKAVIRENNPKFGTIAGDSKNIPGNPDFLMKRVAALDKAGNRYYIEYRTKQPIPIDFIYTVSFFTNKYEMLNKFNQLVNEKFKAIECYIRPQGHFIPMKLNDITDESEYSIDNRRFYSQSYVITVMGYVMPKENFSVVEVPALRFNLFDGDGNEGKSYAEIEELECEQDEKIPYNYSKVSLKILIPPCKTNGKFTIDCDFKAEKIILDNVKYFKLFVNDKEIEIANDYDFNEKLEKIIENFELKKGDNVKITNVSRQKSADISKIEILGYDYTNIIDNLNNKEIKTDDISENC